MQWKSLAVALLLSAQDVYGAPAEVGKRQSSAALMRFECSQLIIERIDPLVQPGIAPSAHLVRISSSTGYTQGPLVSRCSSITSLTCSLQHQVAGGNSFNVTMDPSNHDPPSLSTCTSCTYADDFSNYWTASLFFKAKNGSFHLVPQATNLGLKGKNGGLTVYYNSPYDGKTKVTAFKPVRNKKSLSVSLSYSNIRTGFPHGSRRPNPPLRQSRAKATLPSLRSQHAAESIRWRTLHW